MKPELAYLTWSVVLTGIIWIPYVLDRVHVGGLLDAVGYPEQPKPLSAWARRMKAAHANAIENLVLFATLVLTANAIGVSNDVTRLACIVYFWSRVVHLGAYTFAVPWLRSLAFVATFLAQASLACQLLSR